jgi:uncharacterized protein
MPFKDITPSDLFKCQRCGDCCKGYGGTFVTQKEIEDIAGHMSIEPDKFIEDYCQLSGGKPVLAQKKNAYCIFWDEVCRIHPVKPRMCRDWPFFKSVLVDIRNWHIMSSLCPGIRTDVPDSIIRECVSKKLSEKL